MYNGTRTHNDCTARERAEDAKLLKESGVHKLIITDREGRCLAYLLAWDSFGYDSETDTHVAVVEPDGRELMTLYTEGQVKADYDTEAYVVTAPNASAAPEIGVLSTQIKFLADFNVASNTCTVAEELKSRLVNHRRVQDRCFGKFKVLLG